MSKQKLNYWRVVLTLAGKDIVDAIKNKTTLTMILGLVMMMLTIEALPLLLKLDDRPRVAIYDAARSTLADDLRRTGTVQVVELRRLENAADAAREASGPLVAVTLPADWEVTDGDVVIEGYVAHWLRPRTASSLVTQVEAALTAVTTRPITIHTETVYPTPTSGGHTVMLSLGLVVSITLITAILVPYLILEEKTAHTLALLRVSPVSNTQLLLGKGLAGTVYGLLAAAVLLAFNLTMVSQWGLMLLALLAIVLFGVGLGLLVGLLVNNEGAVQLWVGLLAVTLMFPLMLSALGGSRLPAWASTVVAWMPTTAVFDLVHLSLSNVWLGGVVWPRLAAVGSAVLLVFAVAGWRLHAWEQ